MVSCFVDIHTHKGGRKNVVSLQNLFVSQLLCEDLAATAAFSCGIHPWYIHSRKKAEHELVLLGKYTGYSNFLALGEAGLDKLCQTNFALQQEIFLRQVELSEGVGKPLIVHCVKAYDELLHIRKASRARQRWIFHGFNSSPEMARQLLDAGCILSFGKLLLNTQARAAKVLARLPANTFFLETDEHTISIDEVYEQTAQLRKQSMESLKKQLFDFFLEIFPTHPSLTH